MNGPLRTIEERNGAWLRIVLDAPPGNLLSLELVRALSVVFVTAAPPGRKWVTIEGAGDDFSFGARIQEHLPGEKQTVLPETHALLRQCLALPCPTAALVHGRCLGGAFELALACDVILAADDAMLGLPEIGLGAFPPAGAVLLPLRVGASRAAAAILEGDARPAAQWRDDGVVRDVASSGTLIDAAGRWFDVHLAPRSATALGAAAVASRLVVSAAAGPLFASAEQIYFDRVLTTDDAAEGVRAFVEKRAPRWRDR
jgi:cyclohexa-1,5-dienecarbonyl-CoA hydratase